MRNWKKYISIGISCCMITGSTPLSAFAEAASDAQVVEIVEEKTEEGANDLSVQAAEEEELLVTAGEENDEGELSNRTGKNPEDIVLEGDSGADSDINKQEELLGAASGTCGTNVKWTLDSAGKLTISGTGAMTDYMDGARAPWYSQASSIVSVSVSSGVTRIGSHAFDNCVNLSNVILPSGLKNIGFDAFAFCKSLKKVTIPSGAATIEQYAFHSCTSLEEVGIPESITTIGAGAFEYCSSLKKVIIPKGVTAIAAYSFSACSSLSEVTIPYGVVTIGHNAFADCRKLESVAIPDSVTTIEDYAFCDCDALSKLYMAQSVKSLGFRSFGFTKCTIKDIYYSGTSMQWATLISLNPSCRLPVASNADSRIHFSAETGFSLGKDTWRQKNRGEYIATRHYARFMDTAAARELENRNSGEDGICAGLVTSAIANYLGYPNLNTYYEVSQPIQLNNGAIKLGANAHASSLHAVDFNYYSTETRMTALDYVKYAYAYQRSQEFRSAHNHNGAMNSDSEELQKTLTGLYNAVLDFQQNGGEPVYIAIGVSLDEDSHAIMGYGIAEENDQMAKIRIYNCNFPDENLYLTLTKENGIFAGWSCPKVCQQGKNYVTWSAADPQGFISYVIMGQEFIDAFTAPYEREEVLLSLTNTVEGAIRKVNEDVLLPALKNLSKTKMNSLGITPVRNDGILPDGSGASAGKGTDFYWLTQGEGESDNWISEDLSFSGVSANGELSVSRGDTTLTASACARGDYTFNTEDTSVEVISTPGTKCRIAAEYVSWDYAYDDDEEELTGDKEIWGYESYTIEGVTDGDASYENWDNRFSGFRSVTITYNYEEEEESDSNPHQKGTVTLKNLDSDHDYEIWMDWDDNDNEILAVYEDRDGDGDCETLAGTGKISCTTHYWDDGEVTRKPTTTAEGIRTYTCYFCEKTRTEKIAKLPVQKQSMYRLYNPNSGEHFYTANAGEKDVLVKLGWKYEGIGWTAPKTSKTPVYRLYNPNAGDHHYTLNKAEKDMLVGVGWKYEQIGWYSDDAKGVPLYRQYNPNCTGAGAHNYTTNKGENDFLVKIGWKAEGIGWYGVKAS